MELPLVAEGPSQPFVGGGAAKSWDGNIGETQEHGDDCQYPDQRETAGGSDHERKNSRSTCTVENAERQEEAPSGGLRIEGDCLAY